MREEEIDLTETLYVAIGKGYVHQNVVKDILKILEHTESGIYLKWLLNRWNELRIDENHFPKRFPKIYRIYYIEDGFEYVDKPFKQSIIDRLCRYNSGQYKTDSLQ